MWVTRGQVTFESCCNNSYRPQRPGSFIHTLNPGPSLSRGVSIPLQRGGLGAAGGAEGA